MRLKATVCVVLVPRICNDEDGGCKRNGATCINNGLDLAKHGSNGLSDERHGLEESSFANQDVEENLVNANELNRVLISSVRVREEGSGEAYLAESVEDSVALRPGWDGRHALHLSEGSRDCGYNVREANDDWLCCGQPVLEPETSPLSS